MKKSIKLILFLFVTINLNASSLTQKAAIGQKLYLEAKCQKCHNQDSKFDAKNLKSKSMYNLNTWVTTCDSFFEVGWFPDEQQDVIQYLNEVYYKY